MLLVTTTPGRGKLGGVVSAITHQGARMQARRNHTQPRTPSQRNNRQLTGATAKTWRALPASARTAWNEAAEPGRSGFQTFVQCNRNLQTIGLSFTLLYPQPRPTFPPLLNFTVAAVYQSGGPPYYLSFWQVDTTPEQGTQFGLVLRASQCLSQAKANIRKSDLRIIAAATNQPTTAYVPVNSWASAWGAGPTVGFVWFTLTLIDPVSGYASAPAKTKAYLNASPTPTPTPWTISFQQFGTTIAQEPGIIYEQDGTAIAGP